MTVNLDKRQFLDPHKFGDGLKLWEQAASSEGGIGSALIVLLAVSNGRGGGDFAESDIVGSWGGDRIAIVGGYGEDFDIPTSLDPQPSTIYARCRIGQDPARREDYPDVDPDAPLYRDISEDVAAFLADELNITYSGTGWRDRRSKDGDSQPPAMRPDIVIGG